VVVVGASVVGVSVVVVGASVVSGIGGSVVIVVSGARVVVRVVLVRESSGVGVVVDEFASVELVRGAICVAMYA